MISPEIFEQHLWEAGIVDPEGIHSEFSQRPGLHGQKIDFDEDKIPTSSPLFEEWVEITADTIDLRYPGSLRPKVLVAVAEGTNRLAVPVAKKLGGGVVGLMTTKVQGNLVVLTPDSYREISITRPDLALVLDDVGTTGRNANNAAYDTHKAGAKKVEVLYTWQRQKDLKELDNAYVKYHSIIRKLLPTFTPRECQQNPNGLCAQGWQLNSYSR